MQRRLAGVLGAFHAANGLAMLCAGSTWWTRVPGAAETGPFNPHLVQDVGAAFLAAGLALGLRAWRPNYWPAALAGSLFLVGHATIHLIMLASGHDHHPGADLAGVVLPAALAVYSAFPAKGEQYA